MGEFKDDVIRNINELISEQFGVANLTKQGEKVVEDVKKASWMGSIF